MKEPDQPKIGFSIAAKISELIRWIRSERIVSVIGGRIDQSPNGKTLVVTAKNETIRIEQPCALKPHIVGNAIDGFSMFITSGISGDFVPTFGVDPVGTSNLQTLGTDVDLYLEITWTPGVAYDSDAAVYYITGGGAHVSSVFILDDTRPADTEAEVDSVTGATTDGVYYILWADLDYTTPPPVFAGVRCGNHQITFCPGALRLLFD